MAIYLTAVTLSAFLLFQVQLMAAKHILPWFGGTPAVWTTSMLFFQLVLLLGYAYSHLVMIRFRVRTQGVIHSIVLLSALAALAVQWTAWGKPVLPGPGWMPLGIVSPVPWILGALLVSVGLPFFALSTTAPLLQAWFAREWPGRSPYPLYALSNAGSLLGVLSYPFIVEPSLSLDAQTIAWTSAFIAFAVLCGLCAMRALKSTGAGLRISKTDPAPETAQSFSVKPSSVVGWITLSALGSLLFLSASNKITEDIVGIPFLWVLPLGLYLVSFIVCFASGKWYSRRMWVVGWLCAMLLWQWTLDAPSANLVRQVAIHLAIMFAGCMVCHGELARSKPSSRHLTAFYLAMSLGGALGGTIAAIISPLLFDGLWELQTSLIGVSLVLFAITRRAQWQRGIRFAAIAATATSLLLATARTAWDLHDFRSDAVLVKRNFYGILRVCKRSGQLVMRHAETVHGSQYIRPGMQMKPTTYYSAGSGVALAIEQARSAEPGTRKSISMGCIGLGTGTLAAYAQKGDNLVFYEINPDVISASQGANAMFTYIERCPGNVETVPCDGRIGVQNEPAGRFDVLVLDAFSGGAVPAHLLTLEAFAAYCRTLKEDGILVLNITNHYMDLAPVVRAAAARLGLAGAIVNARAATSDSFDSKWFLLSRNPAILESKLISSAKPVRSGPALNRPWTDNFNNLFEVLTMP